MSKLPKRYLQFMEAHPEVGKHYRALGDATLAAGPLDRKTAELIKIGIALGAGLETAVKSHTRKALEAGANPDEVRHAAMLATTTVGFPSMMMGLAWADDVLDKED